MASAEAKSIDTCDAAGALRSGEKVLMPTEAQHAADEMQSSGRHTRVLMAHAVADRLLARAHRDRRTIDPIQMQKLVYLAQGWALALMGRQLFREPIEVSEHGPLVPELHRSLSRFGAGPIHRELFAASAITNAGVGDSLWDLAEVAIVDGVWEAYGAMSGPQLVSLIDEPNAPWDTARRQAGPGKPGQVSLNALRQWTLDRHRLADRDLDFGRSPCDLMKAAARSPIVVTQESVAIHRAERSKAVQEAEVSRKSWTVAVGSPRRVRNGRCRDSKLALAFASLAVVAVAGFILCG